MPSPQPARQHAGDADLDKLERLALRRRKVEAIESLAHTAALFLAEYVSRNNREPERINPAGGAGRNDGVDYAAAAAGMAVSVFLSLLIEAAATLTPRIDRSLPISAIRGSGL